MSEKDLGKRIKLLEKQMLDHARNLEFEKAARVRDQLALLREQAFGAAGHDQRRAALCQAPAACWVPSRHERSDRIERSLARGSPDRRQRGRSEPHCAC